MNALRFTSEWENPYVFLIFCWLIFLTIIYFFNKNAASCILSLFHKNNLSKPITLLYDGDCPICKREITHLQRHNTKQLVHFIDISTQNYQKESYANIDYNMAMKAIHAIDASGNVLKGPAAFQQLYIRCGYPMLSLLYGLPILHAFFSRIYYLFAKYRLQITGRKSPINKKSEKL